MKKNNTNVNLVMNHTIWIEMLARNVQRVVQNVKKEGKKIYCKVTCKSDQVFNPITSKCVNCSKNCKDKNCQFSPIFF